MSNSIKISIVIPIYNAEKYIKKCITSILSQAYENIELILINDGSKDNSLTICNKYKKLDHRVIIINQANQGVSKTRNNGINIATGEYILFIDADDYIDKEYISSFLKEKLNQNTLLIQDLVRVENNKSIITDNYKYKEYKTKDLGEIFQNNILNNGFPFCKLYNLNLIKKYQLQFKSDIKFGEDLIFFLEYYKHIDKLKFIKEHKYFYLIHKESASFKNYTYEEMEKSLSNLLKTYKDIGEFYKTDIKSINEIKNSLSLFMTLTLYTIYDPRNINLYKANRLQYLKKFTNTYDLSNMNNSNVIKRVYVKLLQYKMFLLANLYLKLYVKYRLKII
ncbi:MULTISPECIES: glycosyltransferase family 2 protein [unclassified Empedobacter]|uniref:glycosyltransferase family 2 protein n=1 Tax=unclassified Empedobacter TaxID=2643773 RepID=UPI0025B8484A|nr:MULTISPECIES: glycosyltransferase family 2 protein [unclassified Empedobacter]